jgi:hypothetical protein
LSVSTRRKVRSFTGDLWGLWAESGAGPQPKARELGSVAGQRNAATARRRGDPDPGRWTAARERPRRGRRCCHAVRANLPWSSEPGDQHVACLDDRAAASATQVITAGVGSSHIGAS